MIKKIFLALIMVLSASSMKAQLGGSCNNPIPVDSNYVGRVDGPCTLWYTAWTYDLPLTVHFIPDDSNSMLSPEIEVDLTCIPGIYADPKLDSLVNMVEDFDVSFPIELLCDKVVPDGKTEWDLSISNNYREQMAQFGITYNVQAFVKVRFFEAGEIRLKPDTAFTSCMENLQYVKLGDTLEITANDETTSYVFPYTDWQNDSIRIVWIGEQTARVWLGTMDCEFIPEVNNGFVWGYYDITESSPKKLYTQNMKDAIKDSQSGGLFYAKVTAPVSGKLVVEKIPMAATQDGAILMEYGKTIDIAANDTNQLYCFPRTWESTKFTSSTRGALQMYISSTNEFGMSSGNPADFTFAYDLVDGEMLLCLSDVEMSEVTDLAVDDYIYVRFASNVSTSILPEKWETSACADKSTLIRPNVPFAVYARSSNTIYRIRLQDWVGGDVTIQWGGAVPLPTYIADACSYTLSASNTHVLLYANVARKGSYNVSESKMATWTSRVDEEGYLYVRFNPMGQGMATFVMEKLIPDPIYTSFDEEICYGATYDWNGTTYSETGTYIQTLVAENGADSIVTLNLTILPEVPETVENVTIKGGDTYAWQGQEYAETGRYTTTLADMNGCDSVLVLNLTVLPKTNPCVEGSTKLNIGDQLTLNLNNAFTVYCINYAEWAAQGATLQWTGEEPLHTFVAETCQFAVAPYNKFVHLYLPITAETALDMNALAPYVDDAGYLYIRFLTEKEGVLTIK